MNLDCKVQLLRALVPWRMITLLEWHEGVKMWNLQSSSSHWLKA